MSISSAATSRALAIAVALAWPAASALAKDAAPGTYGRNPAGLAAHLDRLVAAYPDTIQGYDDTHLVLRDGTRFAIDDGREDKSFDELLDLPDIGDMFAFVYPADADAAQPPVDFDPGRVRVEGLFKALYGDCEKGDLTGRMSRVDWVPGHGGKPVWVATAQGVDRALKAVSAELDALPASFGKFLAPSSGTYNCRPIAGTNRMSMHSYGVAIDINTDFSDYWRWTKPGADGLYPWKNRIPPEVVAIFEKHGFIWGGRWYHYDTMHFEYRPDLLAAAD
ncbi:MAG: M15 family metallopeptidase [Rhizobiaceae bacterium]|nr:M15 family metallopeptidase [Rhizobiaceae bacterium]